jgi:hypothetical protein
MRLIRFFISFILPIYTIQGGAQFTDGKSWARFISTVFISDFPSTVEGGDNAIDLQF